jgi:hypothetical protein
LLGFRVRLYFPIAVPRSLVDEIHESKKMDYQKYKIPKSRREGAVGEFKSIWVFFFASGTAVTTNGTMATRADGASAHAQNDRLVTLKLQVRQAP